MTLNATLRVFSSSVYAKLSERIRDMLQGLTLATGATFEFKKLMQYPCVDNPRPLVEDFYRYVDMSDVVLVEPAMAAEDFACYQQEAPGLFLFLGSAAARTASPSTTAASTSTRTPCCWGWRSTGGCWGCETGEKG